MTVDKPTERDLRFILANLREVDRRELAASGAAVDVLPAHILQHCVFAFVAVDRWVPVAAWGMLRSRKGVGAGFAFGTTRWGQAMPAILKNIKRFVIPFLLTQGYHRVECAALAHRRDVERFLEIIGASPEAVLRQWGANGEDFVSYRWLADEHRAETQTKGVDHHACH